MAEASRSTPLRALAGLFLRVGATSFGGPAAHIAMMQREVVERRAWLTHAEFLDLLGATNLIPGPSSTEMAIHIGYHRAGWRGLVVAGTCFLVPAVLITLALAWAYVRFGSVPEVSWLLYGVKPVMLVIVAQAIAMLAPHAMASGRQRLLAVAVALLAFLGVNEILLLLAAGVVSVAAREGRGGASLLGALTVAPAWSAVGLAGAAPVGLGALFWVFFKTGSVLFGSGYVLLAFLEGDLVERLAWLTRAQLIDAIAIGQVTPGPVFSTATFIGYLLAGPGGALVATAGIFLPGFLFVALSSPWIPRLRSSARVSAFLDGVNAASLALMGVVTVALARAAIVDATTLGVLLLAVLAVWRLPGINSTWLVLAGALLGWLARTTGLA